MEEHRAHRKQVTHYHKVGDFHELMFSCYRRKPLLTNDVWRRKLSGTIQAACEELEFQLVAFVYMPEHVHLLVYPRQTDPDIGRFLARLKQPFSTQIKEILTENNSRLLEHLTVRERPGKMSFRFWQEGPGFDRNIYSNYALSASIEYIHTNPVKRGLCSRAIDWKWSSARYFIAAPPKQQESDLPFIDGIPNGAFD